MNTLVCMYGSHTCVWAQNGIWYSTGVTSLMWYNSETLGRGNNIAIAEDFQSEDSSSPAKWGEFTYTVPGDTGTFITDPIEGRIMMGQSVANEELGVVVMEIEVYGCPLPDAPVCGDGITTPPETCDLGFGENTFFSTQCDHMCTKIKPPVCHYTGECPTPDSEPVAETVGLGAGYVAESQLPAWVVVEDVDFGRYFNGCEDYSSAATEECSNVDDSERECPGDLTKTWHLTAKEFMCSHQVTSDAIVKNKHYEPYSMLVSGPSGGNIKYASIRGHVRGSGRGAPVSRANDERRRERTVAKNDRRNDRRKPARSNSSLKPTRSNQPAQTSPLKPARSNQPAPPTPSTHPLDPPTRLTLPRMHS